MSRLSLEPTAGVLAVVGGAIGLGYGMFIVLFLTAEILTDPGGWFAALIVLAWLLPMAALSAIALLRPQWGVMALSVVGGLVLLVNLVAMLIPQEVYSFEDENGPILLVIGLAVWIPSTVLGFFRPLVAGCVILATGTIPALVNVVLLVALGRPAVIVSFAIVVLPITIAAILFVIGGILNRRREQSLPRRQMPGLPQPLPEQRGAGP